MFDDLIIRKKEIEAKIRETLTDEFCPVCKAGEVEPTSGVFVSPTRFVQHMICIVCGVHWEITYDQNLNVVDVVIGG